MKAPRHHDDKMIRVGIFFGGISREREVSFASGRTVYDNLDRFLFSPIPIFVDSLGRWIVLKWEYLYRGSIRDFYPPPSLTRGVSGLYEDLYIESFAEDPDILEKATEVGQVIRPHEIATHIDFAFLALHGMGGEDGSLQGILEWYGVPYSGCGVRASGQGIDKAWQKGFFKQLGLPDVPHRLIERADWLQRPAACLDALTNQLKGPWVVKPAKEGSSIGVGLASTRKELQERISTAFFVHTIHAARWRQLTATGKVEAIKGIANLKSGLGMPIILGGKEKIHHPEALMRRIEQRVQGGSDVLLEGFLSENTVVVEQVIAGREFSCIVIEDAKGRPLALPPTEILKSGKTYDYKAKYLPGVVRKRTPIDIAYEGAQRIRRHCASLYALMGLEVYARIDGFFTRRGTVYLNDPNTASGMQLSSFFFHQAAVVGLSPPAFLNYVIASSLRAECRRNKRPHRAHELLRRLEGNLEKPKQTQGKIRVGIITGGASSEKHIAVETARNIYEKLASSSKYLPRVFFLMKEKGEYVCYPLPIHMLLKDNATDIEEHIRAPETNPLVAAVRKRMSPLKRMLGAEGRTRQGGGIRFSELRKKIDTVFIAMHGRPGEDGTLQGLLERWGMCYNGSRAEGAALMMDKYATNQKLRAHGIRTPTQRLMAEQAYREDKEACVAAVEGAFSYPLVLKPQDDGCSTGVCKVSGRGALIEGLDAHFRTKGKGAGTPRNCLIENFIGEEKGTHCQEITVGLLTHYKQDLLAYEIFDASAVIKEKSLLSVEEKFLTGGGGNITPARFSPGEEENERIGKEVRATMERVAKALQIEGYARVDAFVRRRKEGYDVVVIEVNALPGMTAATCIFHQAARAGYTPYAFIDRIISFGIEREKAREGLCKK